MNYSKQMEELINCLQQFQVFEEMGTPRVRFVAETVQIKKFPVGKGDLELPYTLEIISHTDKAEGLYFIKSGKCKLMKELEFTHPVSATIKQFVNFSLNSLTEINLRQYLELMIYR